MNCICPQCHSKAFKRNGFTRHGKQNHRCLDCGRQFSLEPYTEASTEDTPPGPGMEKYFTEKENQD